MKRGSHIPEPKCLGQIGTMKNVFSVRRPDGKVVTVVIPPREPGE